MTKTQLQIKALISLFEQSAYKFFPDFLEAAQSEYQWATEEICNLALEAAHKREA